MNGSFRHEVRLKDAFQKLAAKNPNVRLLDVSVYRRPPSNDWGDRLEDFATQAADHLHRLLSLEEIKVAGVGWGATVASVITGLLLLQREPRKNPVTFIPTCGESLAREASDASSSDLAKMLDEAINRSFEHHLSLAGVPAFIPMKVADHEAETIRQFIIRPRDDYLAIFDGENALVHKMDLILTSLASSDQENKMFTVALEKSGIKKEELKKRVKYDIGGANVANDDDEVEVPRWESRWTGIKLKTYEQCAERAKQQLKPGVVVVAIGEKKATFVRDAVERGLINTLLIDDELAEKLIQSLGSA